MKKLLLLFALVLTLCSTAMAQDLFLESEVGTIGTLDGRQAMVVDLGGTIGKVAVATRNVGAEKASDKMAMITEGTKFNLADANNPEKNGLTDGWYVPSKAELDALKSHLTPNKGVHCVEWKVTETATLYLPTWSAGSNLYYGNYVSSDRKQVDDTWKCWIYEYLFYDSDNSFGGNDLEECDEQETENCLIRPFHKLPDDYYIDADGVSHNVNAYEVSSSDDQITWGEAGKESWYIVKGNDVTLSQGAICAGNVNLILADGAKLTATGMPKKPGILVSGDGNSLTIYGQSAQTGQLIAAGGTEAAGIGGGSYGSGSNITINGGTVTANGGNYGAGIGGGRKGKGSNITINGGTVTANGGLRAAGIGGGSRGSGSNITINGGTVTANGGDGADGIGGGLDGSGSGSVLSSDIYVANTHVVKAGNAEETNYVIARDTVYDLAGSLAGKQYVTIEPESAPEAPQEVTYIDENGIKQTVMAHVVLTRSTLVTLGEQGKTTWYVVTHADEQLPSSVCQGDVRLILADGAKLTATGWTYEDADYWHSYPGIQVSGEGNSLTIYDQAEHTGQLVAFGGEGSAGIGGNNGAGGSNITINGGIITATGGIGANENFLIGGAGIGGGGMGSGSNITINGGTVTATGGETKLSPSGEIIGLVGGTGIGGGGMGSGSNITINGGTVTATGGENAAGIGGGNGGSGSNIIINDGTVTANGGSNGTGIGGGYFSSASNITINGGIVTAIGKDYAAGIGCANPKFPISGIFVSPVLTLKAGPTANPTNVIENTSGDLAEILKDYHYITVSDAVCNITANQDRDNTENYYSTFYSNKKAYEVPEGVTAYIGAEYENVLRLTAIATDVIPAGEPVVLKLTTTDNTEGKKKFALTATTTTATKSTANKLLGTDVPMTLGAGDYALSLGHNGVGFYLWDGQPIAAHKAYLTLANSNIKALTFVFEEEGTTGIDSVNENDNDNENLYDLRGMRVSDGYKGIVIKNGKKVIR